MAAGRRSGATRRTTTALLTGTIGFLSSVAVAVPVWAQQAPADGYFATPPPVDMSKLLPDSRQPDKKYKQSKGCVQRSTLGQNIVLKYRPWGQDYLLFALALVFVRVASFGGVGWCVLV